MRRKQSGQNSSCPQPGALWIGGYQSPCDTCSAVCCTGVRHKKCVNMTRREISKGSEYRRFNTKLVNLQGCKSVQLGSHESL